MRQSCIKRLEVLSPSLEESKVVVDQLIKHLEAVKPGPGESKALVERLKNGTCRVSDRQRLLEILEAEEAALKFLASWHPPSLPSHGRHRKKHNKPRVKRARRHHRR
jgi:hypothetical protein